MHTILEMQYHRYYNALWHCLLLWPWRGTSISYYSSVQKVRVGPQTLSAHAQFQKWPWKLVWPKPDQPDRLLRPCFNWDTLKNDHGPSAAKPNHELLIWRGATYSDMFLWYKRLRSDGHERCSELVRARGSRLDRGGVSMFRAWLAVSSWSIVGYCLRKL